MVCFFANGVHVLTEPATRTLKNIGRIDDSCESVTVYDKEGFATGDNFNVNSAFAKKNDQGEYVIHFGGDKNQDNYLDIYPGWNDALRIYSPTSASFDGSWTPPELELSK